MPKRSLGFDVGAHVYRGTLGPAHLGFGVDLVKSRGTVSTTPVVAPVGATSGTSSSSSGTGTAGPVDVVTHFTGIAPQISFNFGGRNGWSYLGGGVGITVAPHVGVRGDLRYYRAFGFKSSDVQGAGLNLSHFDFWRAAGGLLFRVSTVMPPPPPRPTVNPSKAAKPTTSSSCSAKAKCSKSLKTRSQA